MTVLYQAWVESEAALIVSDGCTGVSGFRRECCLEHDLAFYYARNPRTAYMGWVDHGDRELAWEEAAPITFEEANSDFKRCHARASKLGSFWWLNPVNLWRWRGVVRFSKRAWNAHRAREAAQEAGV